MEIIKKVDKLVSGVEKELRKKYKEIPLEWDIILLLLKLQAMTEDLKEKANNDVQQED